MVHGVSIFIRKEIIDTMFILKPIQNLNQCERIITIMVPEMMVSRMILKLCDF